MVQERPKEGMPMITRFLRAWPVLGVALLLGGCHRVHVASAAAPAPSPASPTVAPAPPRPAPPARAAAAAPRSLTDDEIFARKSLDDLNRERPLGDAYFDYDQSTLRDDARAALKRDAEWLARWQSVGITIQGQCDERGSAEYNLALGDRRAEVVRDYLTSLNIPASRIQVISLGKESPVCGDDRESCWSLNRRGHFVITKK
jgi:peptidoglycan-associated lipoprotein